MEEHWAMIWHQAISRSFLNGKAFGWNKTVIFHVTSPVTGNSLRLRFSNRHGASPYEFGAVRICAGTQSAAVMLNGKEQFSVMPGGVTVSDICPLGVKRGDEIEVLVFYTNAVLDSNMTEEDANLLRGNRTEGNTDECMHKPLLAKILGAYNAVPSIEAVEVLTDEPAKAIVAFGDNITAMSRWTKPLAKRLADTYREEYVLLNSGISGNCLLYEPGGIFGPVYGKKGITRFSQDVLEIPGLDTVILGLGVNDVSYLSDKTAGEINLPAYQNAVTAMTDELHARGNRVVIQTITPRLGVSPVMGRFTPEMEKLRLQFNEWIRTAGIFDYVFDAEAVVREERPDGFYYREELQQGDHLHPNAAGGQRLADAFDLEMLTGKRG
ncbi:MAG: hypothetical protein IKP86_11485 [Anaerolineaceae bacterium]|nr:hypothetical protein [Anaerolineaceae bacterium]